MKKIYNLHVFDGHHIKISHSEHKRLMNLAIQNNRVWHVNSREEGNTQYIFLTIE